MGNRAMCLDSMGSVGNGNPVAMVQCHGMLGNQVNGFLEKMIHVLVLNW